MVITLLVIETRNKFSLGLHSSPTAHAETGLVVCLSENEQQNFLTAIGPFFAQYCTLVVHA